MLRVENLESGYGQLQVLAGVSITAEPSEITVIVGPNGSGKSTLLKSIFGLTNIYSGRIHLDGGELTGLPTHQIARRGIAYLPQTENVFFKLRIRENLVLAGYAISRNDFEDRLREVEGLFPILKKIENRRAGTLSGGERQMVAMAMALLRKPKVIMFDEPTGSLAPRIAGEVLDKIVELTNLSQLTVILVEQSTRLALKRGQKCYLMVNGRVLFEGEPDQLLAHSELSKLYLGVKPD